MEHIWPLSTEFMNYPLSIFFLLLALLALVHASSNFNSSNRDGISSSLDGMSSSLNEINSGPDEISSGRDGTSSSSTHAPSSIWNRNAHDYVPNYPFVFNENSGAFRPGSSSSLEPRERTVNVGTNDGPMTERIQNSTTRFDRIRAENAEHRRRMDQAQRDINRNISGVPSASTSTNSESGKRPVSLLPLPTQYPRTNYNAIKPRPDSLLTLPNRYHRTSYNATVPNISEEASRSIPNLRAVPIRNFNESLSGSTRTIPIRDISVRSINVSDACNRLFDDIDVDNDRYVVVILVVLACLTVISTILSIIYSVKNKPN